MDPVPLVQSANRQIARAALTVMLAVVFSSLVGLLRDSFIANSFGVGSAMDSFYAANRVTELLFNLAAGGALASAFVPTFTGFLAKEDRAGAWRLASAVCNLVLLVMIAVSLLITVFAPQVVRYGLYVLAPDSSPGQLDLTVALLRLMIPSVAIFGISGLVMGILNSHQVFLVPAIAPAMYSLGLILGATVLAPHWGMGIHGLALGAVLGAVLHLLVQVPSLVHLKDRRYFATLGMDFPAVGQVVRLMLPRLFGVAVVQLNFFVSTIIGLSLSNGSVSSISYAFRLMLMPQMAIAQSIAIAALPTFSAQIAHGRLEDMRSSLSAALRVVLLLSLPACVGLILLRMPLVSLLYQRGEFTPEMTGLVAWALLWYAAGLVGHSLVEVVSRAFYALHDTKTPVIVGASAMGLNVVFSLLFPRLFAGLGWMPHGGLALANSLATALEMAVLLALMRQRLHGLEGRRLRSSLGQAALATAAMGLAVQGWMWAVANGRLIILAGGLVIGVAAYGLVAFILRVPEAFSLLNTVKVRLARLVR